MEGRKQSEIKATLSIIENLIEKAGTDCSFIVNTTGLNEDHIAR